ncbi:nuclease [Gloeophyllum trabeum ATCC 11539]|uniref:Nuclease n=1 Tax=Gloeophyllum trabeum (strain ATCC 11539 / FP-39264 / Madison 617) TaxID=670483 RepID=S7R657_GLOTA|nr:nuclease [Gloeophyllum trabeum ATCC 11539]EPQ49870.1 nuclease [Gloeophyllum trabeum ATCC 11539]
MSSWLPWSSSSSPSPLPERTTPQPSPSPEPASSPSPSSVPAPLAFALGALSSTLAALAYARYFRRLPTGEWVTPDVFARRRWIAGVVTSVGDADNFRLYHTPGAGWRWALKFRRVPTASKDLRNQTIHIRMAGIDAPEAAHFGRPAQPYAAEALAWLKAKLEGRRVYCQLVRRDQYGRIVAHVVLPPRLLPLSRARPVQLEMLAAGWVTTYEQAGAEYGHWGLAEFKRVEAEARAARRGIWKTGALAETPAEYKRRYASSPPPPASGGDPERGPRKLGRFKRFWPAVRMGKTGADGGRGAPLRESVKAGSAWRENGVFLGVVRAMRVPGHV